MTDLLSLATTLATDWHDDGPGWWFVFPLLWLVLIGTVAFLLLRGRMGPRQHRETAVEVLDRRYAEGEMTPEEYRERRQVLSEED